MKTEKRGFTLIELIVVLAILAIVAAIAVPTAFGSIKKAENAAGKASIDNLISAVRVADGLMQIDDPLGTGQFILGMENGKFTTTTSGGLSQADSKRVISALESAGISMPDKSVIRMTGRTKDGHIRVMDITYYPKGYGEDSFYYAAEEIYAGAVGYYRITKGGDLEPI